MLFGLYVGELLVVSFFLVTSFNCIITYFCCSKSLKVLDKEKSFGKAINRFRVYDQYLLSKINILAALIYFGMSSLFIDTYINTRFYFLLSCLLSFILTLLNNFLSGLCYCYTGNVLLETKIDEVECFFINFKKLAMIYFPFVSISFALPFVDYLNMGSNGNIILSILLILLILVIWSLITPKLILFNYKAKKLDKNDFLSYRLEQLLKAHDVKKYEIYCWDSSKSKESNAMVIGFRTNVLLVSSTLIEDVTLPELEAIITHEIGHIKNNHVIKKMIGKLFLVCSLIFMIMFPSVASFKGFNVVLFYILMISVFIVSLFLSIEIERKYELEADNYAACYNDPKLFASALKKIIKYEETSESEIDEMFQSHPNIEERISKINEDIKD